MVLSVIMIVAVLIILGVIYFATGLTKAAACLAFFLAYSTVSAKAVATPMRLFRKLSGLPNSLMSAPVMARA